MSNIAKTVKFTATDEDKERASRGEPWALTGKTIVSQNYEEFLHTRDRECNTSGFAPTWMPDFLFDFQSHLVDWSIRQGRAAILADCGMGKTPMSLVWAQNVIQHTNKSVLFVTPLAVGQQILLESDKFGVDAERSRTGKVSGKKIWITNYQQLHKFDSSEFGGVVCDESSAIKNFQSATKEVVTEFLRTIEYRLLGTATAAPNDYWELGTASEALGYLGFRDMLTAFFKQDLVGRGHQGWGRAKYRFKGHASEPFWKWVSSWARAIRKPSDLGFDDSDFILPELHEIETVVTTKKAREGMLFPMAGRNLNEQRAERRNSIEERCEAAKDRVESHDGPSVIWCELNDEGDQLTRVIDGAVQVSGSMTDDQKEERLTAFSNGEIQN